MIYFKAQNGGRKLIIIGLTKDDAAKLFQGETKQFPGENVGFDGDVLVLGGESEKSIANRLQGNFAVGALYLPPGVQRRNDV